MPDTPTQDQAQRQTLLELFSAAVAAAHPDHCLEAFWPQVPELGRLIVFAAGKAAAAMARAAENHYGSILPPDRFSGLAVTRHGYGQDAGLRRLTLIEAGHPVPDAASEAAAEAALRLAGVARPEDLFLVLMSGGASALLAAPAAGIQLADKQNLTRALLRSGATIAEINCVRKHLSRIKGGRLACAAGGAKIVTLAISDVPGDAPDAIGSGPTVADPGTLADARAVLGRHGVTPPPAIAAALMSSANETPKPADPIFAHAEFVLAAAPHDMLKIAAARAEALGFRPVILGDSIEGEARDVAKMHAAIARERQTAGERVALLSGGELTVTVRGSGRGGPNQEYALALAMALDGAPGIYALAGDTDGTDGGTGAVTDPAGAIVTPATLSRSKALGRDAAIFLANNGATDFFEPLGDLVVSGPTQTNVNDFRVILVEPDGFDS